jgi:hypothetical protein
MKPAADRNRYRELARRYSVLSNLSLAGLKTTPPQPRLTVTNATRIISLSPSKYPLTSDEKLKAHFRRGQAYVFLKDDDSAERDFNEAIKLGEKGSSGGEGVVKVELNKLKSRKQAHIDKQRKAYGKMFG